jgi:phosphatidylinositol alpha-mannosyltransferase
MRTTQMTGWSSYAAPLWPFLGNRVPWIAVSEFAKRELSRLGVAGESVDVVPNPISLSAVVGLPRREKPAFTVGYFGSRRTVKGFRLLPEIARRLSKEGVILRVYSESDKTGNPAANDDIADRLLEFSPFVEFVGQQMDLRGEYSSCNVVLSPSLRESFGRVPVEALANGIPVVASDIPAFRVLADASRAVELFDLERPEEAAACIIQLRNDTDRYDAMAARGPPFASAFQPQTVADKIIEIYHRVLTGHALR